MVSEGGGLVNSACKPKRLHLVMALEALQVLKKRGRVENEGQQSSDAEFAASFCIRMVSLNLGKL